MHLFILTANRACCKSTSIEIKNNALTERPFIHPFSASVWECLMTEDDVDRIDRNRRHFLTVATVVTGVAGAGLASIPFLASLRPSARAQALGAPVEVPLGSIQPGEMVRVLWRGRLVFVLRRERGQCWTSLAEGLSTDLRDPKSEVADQQPDYAANDTRSLQARVAGGRGFLHPSRLCAAGGLPAAAGRGLGWRFLLPLSRVQIRSRRAAFTRACRHQANLQ